MRLYNYCIDNREATIGLQHIYKVPDTQQLPHEPTKLAYIPTDAPNVNKTNLRAAMTSHVQMNTTNNDHNLIEIRGVFIASREASCHAALQPCTLDFTMFPPFFCN
jgi:hypothetical protein